MAVLSLLFSFIARKIGSIVQAIFGWSVTALFGKLPTKKQLVVTVALVLSIAWPVFVVGLFFPAVAGWALAFLPLESWVGPTPLRVVWAALAIVAPAVVGLLVRYAAPSPKGSLARSALSGYPLALGFFVSFFVTALTVPAVKVVSFFRRWTDTHVYVQPRPGRYNAVVRELAEACARAGAMPAVESPPRSMMIATNVLKVLAKSAVTPIVAEELLSIRSDGLQIILYPADLLLRGEPTRVARMRAMMTRTAIDADAYLVASPAAQEVQDDLGRLLDVIRRHETNGHRVGKMASRRLAEIWTRMNESELPFDEWVMLESIARRIERRIVDHHTGDDIVHLDDIPDGLERVAERANQLERDARRQDNAITKLEEHHV